MLFFRGYFSFEEEKGREVSPGLYHNYIEKGVGNDCTK